MPSDLEATLTALEARRCEAIGTGDLYALAEVLDDDYLHVLAPGRVVDKAQYLEMIRNGPRRPERGALRVRVYGDAAVLTGTLHNHIGAPNEVRRVIAAYCTQVAVKRANGWRFVSYILTRKPTKPV
ncbi:MAG: nuclear transport factor 2 family protein [Myxococcales bacterium]|nr:nuclear transport factor 2 family protein [Myxococcales bacterium]MDD9970685.1 nuclear transport factor 2 family protein [Myxococcales bacterium]